MAKRDTNCDGKAAANLREKRRSENAEKQARWRRRHPDKYEAFKERMRMQARINKGNHRPGGFLVWDIVDQNGDVVNVTIRHHLRPAPKGGQMSAWLPASPVDYSLARSIRDARLKQIEEWRTES